MTPTITIPPTVQLPYIHLHDGHMRLYIVGSDRQTRAFFPVTRPNSKVSVHGTEEEREIANKAVKALRISHGDDPHLSNRTIVAELRKHGWEPDPLTRYPL